MQGNVKLDGRHGSTSGKRLNQKVKTPYQPAVTLRLCTAAPSAIERHSTNKISTPEFYLRHFTSSHCLSTRLASLPTLQIRVETLNPAAAGGRVVAAVLAAPSPPPHRGLLVWGASRDLARAGGGHRRCHYPRPCRPHPSRRGLLVQGALRALARARGGHHCCICPRPRRPPSATARPPCLGSPLHSHPRRRRSLSSCLHCPPSRW